MLDSRKNNLIGQVGDSREKKELIISILDELLEEDLSVEQLNDLVMNFIMSSNCDILYLCTIVGKIIRKEMEEQAEVNLGFIVELLMIPRSSSKCTKRDRDKLRKEICDYRETYEIS